MSDFILKRRRFLYQASGMAAASATVPYWFTGERARADETKAKNDRPHIGAIGVGGRGLQVTQSASRFGEVVAVCDVDRKHAEKAKATFGGKPAMYEDYRKLLERQDLDVIINGTPDHWHTAINLAACRAGLDVYAEKPLTLTIDEGIILRKVVEATNPVFQVGTKMRSHPTIRRGCELVRNGRVGKLEEITVTVPFRSTRGGPFETRPVPPVMNWDFWQGQAPARPYCPERTHYTFRWWYEYSGGIVTDWGAHYLDVAHWAMGREPCAPLSVEGTGTFPNQGKPNCYNTPDIFEVRLTYPGGIKLVFNSSKEARAGLLFRGDRGRIFLNRGGVFGKPAEELKENPLPADAVRLYQSNDHVGNFFDCVKTRKQPISDFESQHRAATACHLANIAIRLGRKIEWDPEKEQIVGDAEANGWLRREQREPYQFET